MSLSQISAVNEDKKDPEEEYFKLAVLSLKMQYNERDTNFVIDITNHKLFKRCKQEGIPFH